ncbi:type I restriction modification DNA specificity domain protein [Parabacteroides distasonis str. 3776 D15 iv]|uniref:Type I restriction modification DNA specificity domain protein n=1 Tax=Parabacteroides distasonis str. 3776 D15 i TaxID=1339342 RepID=A0AB34LCH9_PARDI|nr:restriction endonuclease subunit S [Parabacteroides distasonis]KDS37718.1 type I restriction modification DNA specificity domain protein [Parabacteroides distasonis str. 3776 D15 i]KDS42743.1 type I restriction modification DNA specificity domain protein [Parabacteroides distasonis str. 3776 Po2 i]KDS72954.1 type I restriction modification DNA specificity domain protein [Parabacteroides distasonis str. 3776 D15 iv]
MKIQKLKELFKFAPKSKMKAGDGADEGNFLFYTSSLVVSKRTDKPQYYQEALILGTGGSASIHYAANPFSTSTDCIVVTPKSEDFKTKFVYYYLLGNLHLLEKGFKGAGLKHISKTYIENIDIPIFPIDIQNKIVSVLDKANALISDRKESLQLLEDLLRAIFLDMFQNDLIEYKQSKKTLADIATIVSGLTKGRKTKSSTLSDVPYLRVANAQDGYFDFSEVKTIQATPDEIEKYNIIKGDLLITEGGDCDKLGRGAVWEFEENKYIYQNHLFRLRINSTDDYSPYWLIQLLRSEFGKYYFLRQAKQTTGIATINKRQVSNFPIPNSPFEKQKEFEEQYIAIHKRKQKLSISLNEISTLFNSILQKAFNGELNFNIDADLDALIKVVDLEKKVNDLSKITSDIAYLQRLIDKINYNEFEDRDLYNKAKHAIFQLLKEGDKVEQVYNENKNISLALK